MIAYIMRGVPGSGKSTKARILAGKDGVICSTDDQFKLLDGSHCFQPHLLPKYHEANFALFCKALKKRKPVVICDNTNIRHEHFRHYIEAASLAGYEVKIISLPHPDPVKAARRNIHGVPECVIRRMIDQWEP